MTRLVTVAAVLLAGTACNSASDSPPAQVPSQFSSPAYSCTLNSGVQPPSKFIPHPDGVADHFIVVLNPSVNDIHATALALCAEYGGTLINTYEVILGGFSVSISASNAESMADDPDVCWVEQDGWMSGA